MTKREKILASAVGVIALLLAAQYGLSSIVGGIQAKQERLDDLRKEVRDKRKVVNSGLLAQKKLNAIANRSLPSDPEMARAAYRAWLVETMNSVQLADILISNSQTVPIKDTYNEYNFRVTAKGSIEQIVEFLYLFYEKDYLHRLDVCDISPIVRDNTQELSMNIKVLGVVTASKDQKAPEAPSKRLTGSLADYKDVIVGRNIFSSENHPPRLAGSSSQKIERGKSVEWKPDAKDPDPGQILKFEFVGDVPRGATIDPKSGEVRWTPRENGKYDFLIAATDSGIPARTAEKKFTVEVIDPPPAPIPTPKPPGFDIARQAFISAVVSGRGGPEVWIRSRTDGKMLELKEGQEIELGSVKGKLSKVHPDYVEFETDGRRWMVGMEQSLADAYANSQID